MWEDDRESVMEQYLSSAKQDVGEVGCDMEAVLDHMCVWTVCLAGVGGGPGMCFLLISGKRCSQHVLC